MCTTSVISFIDFLKSTIHYPAIYFIMPLYVSLYFELGILLYNLILMCFECVLVLYHLYSVLYDMTSLTNTSRSRMEEEMKSLKAQISDSNSAQSSVTRPRPKRVYLNTYSISEEVSENPQTRV